MTVSHSLLFLYDKIFLYRLHVCHVQNTSVLMFSRESNVRWCSDYIKLLGKLEGLYDAYLSLTSLTSDQEALQSTLVIAGFSWENLERFVARFLGTYGWTP